MKYFTLILLTLFLTACGRDDDHLSIQEYISENSLETEVTASGLHYIINAPGNTERAALTSNINIDYNGFFLGGDAFDRGTDVTFPLQGLIAGWQEGIRLIGKGGSITLLVPSGLAYGPQGRGPIPGNTDLGFDITLHDFD